MTPPRPTYDIVCFANDWAGDPLSKKHIMRRLARRHRVLWVDSLGNRAPRLDGRDLRRILNKLGRFLTGPRQVEPNLWVLTPLALPLYGSTIARRLNAWFVGRAVRAALATLKFGEILDYTFVPASAWVVGRLGESRVVYHCVDEYASFAGAGQAIGRLEQRLLERSDLVLACSQPLVERKRAHHSRVILVRHGVDHAHFARALDEATPIPLDIQGLPRPIIGFHGLIAEWVDLKLVRRVAAAFPQASVVLVGDLRTSAASLAGATNVHLLGRKLYADLPGYCRAFDVALLPFVLDDLTIHANPLKLREYLAAGLPVVASDIPEAHVLEPWLRVASSEEDFVRQVGEALGDPPSLRRERSQAMLAESWDAKVEEIEVELDRLMSTPRERKGNVRVDAIRAVAR